MVLLDGGVAEADLGADLLRRVLGHEEPDDLVGVLVDHGETLLADGQAELVADPVEDVLDLLLVLLVLDELVDLADGILAESAVGTAGIDLGLLWNLVGSGRAQLQLLANLKMFRRKN